MIHVRKTLTKREQEEYKRWLERHRATFVERTPAQREADAASYWAKRAQENAERNRAPTAHIPSVPIGPAPKVESKFDVTTLDYDERQAYLKREEAARERTKELQNRTGPAYNKGPSVYYSDGMLESMKTGSHRRR